MTNIADTCIRQAVNALNLSGRALGSAGLQTPSLAAGRLMQAARRRSRLDDFGPWRIEEPLAHLLESYENEADLTMLGRITVRELVVSLLRTLLELEADRRRHGEIEAQRITAPVFIIGLPRTGTTLLHGLMSEDPGSRVPRTWEVMYPTGFPTTPDAIDRYRSRTASRLGWANRLAPEFKRIHPIAPDLPQECIAVTAPVFMSIQFHTTHNVPSYENWLEQADQSPAYAFHRRFLQHLQAQRPGDRWVLKAPGHLFALAALLGEYPDAKIVQTHRDPLRVMASMASHATVLRRAFSDSADPREIAADWTARWSRALDDFLAVRDRHAPGQFLDVDYDEIEADPLAAVTRIYDFLDWELTDEARDRMQAFLDANPKNKHGVHRYSLAEYGLDRDTELERFGDYCRRFEIKVQAD